MQDSMDPSPSSSIPGHWYGSELSENDWRLEIPTAAIDELDSALDLPASEDITSLPPMPAVEAVLSLLQQRLFKGIGVAVAGRLPAQEWGTDRTRRAASMLAHLMGAPTEQTHDGVTLYAVEDTGAAAETGVRRSLTNAGQPFHSDAPWIRQPPWIVSLYCLRAARTGGLSRCVSLRAIVSDLEQSDPDLAARLTRDMVWHRQSEHAPDDVPVSRHPVVWKDEFGQWCGRMYADYITSGYERAGEPIDAEAQRALEAIERMSNEEHRPLEYRLEGGDIAWLNNRWCLHARSAFETSESDDHPRLLLRVWHRPDTDVVTLDS
jgi:alpha-ketoglutarate-dependent taurine dioxygenase